MGKPKRKDLPDLSHLAVVDAEITVKATPKAAYNAVVVTDTGVKIMVTTAPENGKATEAIRNLLARAMGVGASNLKLLRGASAREKVFIYIG